MPEEQAVREKARAALRQGRHAKNQELILYMEFLDCAYSEASSAYDSPDCASDEEIAAREKQRQRLCDKWMHRVRKFGKRIKQFELLKWVKSIDILRCLRLINGARVRE